jgi:acyl carrier protein phosphodiesterase
VDVWFDHLLARAWPRFHDASLEVFAARVAADLAARRDEIPPESHPFLDFLLRTKLLVSYRERGGIERALLGMSRRVGRENPLGTGLAALEGASPGLAADFEDFFPHALDLARSARNRPNIGGP